MESVMQSADVQTALIAREFGTGAAIAHAASSFATAMVAAVQDAHPESIPDKEAYAELHKQFRSRVTTLMREIVAEKQLGTGGVNFKVDLDTNRN